MPSICMDLNEIILALRNERKKLDRLIAFLEQLSMGAKVEKTVGKGRPGRKSMDEPARKEVSERMKKYWASRRKKQQEPGGSD